MDKAPDAFRTISEVAEDLDVPQHVLRFWETRFSQIKPMKRSRRPALLPSRRRRSVARHLASSLRRGLHHPRGAAHPARAGHQDRPECHARRLAAAGWTLATPTRNVRRGGGRRAGGRRRRGRGGRGGAGGAGAGDAQRAADRAGRTRAAASAATTSASLRRRCMNSLKCRRLLDDATKNARERG